MSWSSVYDFKTPNPALLNKYLDKSNASDPIANFS